MEVVLLKTALTDRRFGILSEPSTYLCVCVCVCACVSVTYTSVVYVYTNV